MSVTILDIVALSIVAGLPALLLVTAGVADVLEKKLAAKETAKETGKHESK